MSDKSRIESLKKSLLTPVDVDPSTKLVSHSSFKQIQQGGNLPGSSPTALNKLKLTTVPLLSAVGLSNIMYTSLHSFYPLYIETHFPSLQSLHFSIIIAIFEVSNLATSLVLGLYIGKMRRKTLILCSNLLLLVSTLSFMVLPSLTEATN